MLYLRGSEGITQHMEIDFDKDVKVKLEDVTGALAFEGLAEKSVISLYDGKGELVLYGKKGTAPLELTLPERGTYVMVIGHPTLRAVVRSFEY